MGDSYREELQRHHKKSGFGPYTEDPAIRAWETLRTWRSLRKAYFAAKARKTKGAPKAQGRLLDA